MKKKYIKNLTTHAILVMLSLLCLTGQQTVSAKTQTENVVTVNELGYATWEAALAAIEGSEESHFDIALLSDLTIDKLPAKACTFSSSDPSPKKILTYNIIQMSAALTFKDITVRIFWIEANGHELTFDTGVECLPSEYEYGIESIYAGSSSSDVETTNLTIKSGTFGWIYGGSREFGKVGKTNVTISGGTIANVYGGGYRGKVSGKATLTLAGGTISSVYASGEDSSCGSAEIIISHDYKDKQVTIAAKTATGSDVTGDCKLTFKEMGEDIFPYTLPCKIEGFTTVALKNSYLTTDGGENIFVVDPAKPTTFEGIGFIAPIGVNTTTADLTAPQLLFKADATHLPYAEYFIGYGNLSGKHIFRANNTYRLAETGDNKKISFTTPTTEGDTLKVKVQETELLSGDSIPVGIVLDIEAVTKDGYAAQVIDKNNKDEIVGTPLTVSKDVDLHMIVTLLPLDLSAQKNDVTISQADGKWQYTTATLTRSTATATPFNGTVKGTLPDGKCMLIDATAQGALTFDAATINSTTTAAPALTIASGAKVSFSGKLTVITDAADQYAIENKGSLTITGANTYITITSKTPTPIQGTFVVKDGATVETNGTPLPTYPVTITDPANGQLLITAGGITVSTGDELPEGAVLTVTAIPSAGYETASVKVMQGTTELTATDGFYTMPGEAITITATFNRVEVTPPTPPAVYHTVTLPALIGAVTNPTAGRHEVEAWDNFLFALTLDADYNQSIPLVKANGTVVTPRPSDGKYVISSVRADQTITIDGIVKNTPPVGNAEIETDNRIYTANGVLYIHVAQPVEAQIVTFGGSVLRSLSLPVGETTVIGLGQGLYIVRLGNGTSQKVKL